MLTPDKFTFHSGIQRQKVFALVGVTKFMAQGSWGDYTDDVSTLIWQVWDGHLMYRKMNGPLDGLWFRVTWEGARGKRGSQFRKRDEQITEVLQGAPVKLVVGRAAPKLDAAHPTTVKTTGYYDVVYNVDKLARDPINGEYMARVSGATTLGLESKAA